MAVLGSGRASIGFPDPVGSILAEYRPKPTHLDPIHAQNLCFHLPFGFLFPPQIPTRAKLLFTFLANGGLFEFFMAVLDPGRLSIGFPDPVGSILAEYEPEPTHLDPIHCIFPQI